MFSQSRSNAICQLSFAIIGCFIIVSSNDITFLVEQPSQLKYLEWPSFQSTLKTATLTLVLVALLIVALSSLSVKDDTSYD
ncbi:hypothetical protein QYF36_020971 [Acer negundo]|nr:hypothetical protein QYF36_020971 [Acer negundo]